MPGLVRKVLIIAMLLGWLSVTFAAPEPDKSQEQTAPTLPLRLTNSLQNFVLTTVDMQDITTSILHLLSFDVVLNKPSVLGGRPLFYHIFRRHIASGLPANSDWKFGNSLFDISLSAAEIKTKIKDIVANANSGNTRTAFVVEDGVLTIKIQIQTQDLVVYDVVDGVYKRHNSGYLMIVAKKVWLGDHWSENLIPATIFPSVRCVLRNDVKVLPQTVSAPSRQQFNLYQKTAWDQYQQELIVDDNIRAINDALALDELGVEVIEDQEIDVIEGIDKNNTVNLYHGYQTLTEGEVTYTGFFVNGEKSGQGKLSGASGVIYDGMWRANTYHGQGVLTYPDGCTYTGEFQYGNRHGSGVLKNAEGQVVYDGEWKNDLYHGIGELHTAEDSYLGKFVAGKRNGHGKATYKNGDIYEGLWHQDKKHGAGAMYCGGKWLYEGVWHNDRRIAVEFLADRSGNLYQQIANYDFLDDPAAGINGFGFIEYKDLRKYKGGLKNGQPHGMGMMQYADGTIYQGEFNLGVRHGAGKITKDGKTLYGLYENNTMITSLWFTDDDGTTYNRSGEADGFIGTNMQNAIKIGRGVITYPDRPQHGQDLLFYKGGFINGKPHGLGTLAYYNGAKYIGKFSGGQKHGQGKLYARYRRQYVLIYDGTWDHDVANGKIYDTAGKPIYEGKFKVTSCFSRDLWRLKIENLDGKKSSPQLVALCNTLVHDAVAVQELYAVTVLNNESDACKKIVDDMISAFQQKQATMAQNELVINPKTMSATDQLNQIELDTKLMTVSGKSSDKNIFLSPTQPTTISEPLVAYNPYLAEYWGLWWANYWREQKREAIAAGEMTHPSASLRANFAVAIPPIPLYTF